MTNILFVSIAFPPKSDAEGLQVAKYLKYLVRLGEGSFAIDAVTSPTATLNMSCDATLEPIKRGVRQIIELPIYENRYSNFLIRKALPWAAAIPDPKFTFYMQAGKVVAELQEKPDLIYSRAYPLSSSILAYRLKRIFGVPWVMHLSDLWADDPDQNYSGLSRTLQERLEKMCFETADVICVTSEKTLNFYKKKYQHLGSRIVHYPNVFDLEDAVAESDSNITSMGTRKANEKFRLVHTGSLVGARSAAPLLDALSQMEQSIQDSVELLLVGVLDVANTNLVKSYSFPFIKLIGQVEYQKSLEIQRSADLLVLIDMPVSNPELRVFFPSKLLDYMLSGTAILAIGDEGSEIQKVMADHCLGNYCERRDIGSIVHCLKAAIRTSVVSGQGQKNRAIDFYSAENNAGRLLSLFREMTSQTTPSSS